MKFLKAYLDLPKDAKWFGYRVSVHHPLGSDWHPDWLLCAGILCGCMALNYPFFQVDIHQHPPRWGVWTLRDWLGLHPLPSIWRIGGSSPGMSLSNMPDWFLFSTPKLLVVEKKPQKHLPIHQKFWANDSNLSNSPKNLVTSAKGKVSKNKTKSFPKCPKKSGL